MKVKVNDAKCIGCGNCPCIAPDVFDFNDEGFAYSKVDTVPTELENDVNDAIEACPTGAIEEIK